MTINLNRRPYFDDFDESKNFHKILFKPGIAVQARELTQLQTIIQNQIERFGTHVFENGSRVLGGTFDPQDPVDYVRVQKNISDIPTIVGAELVGQVSNLKARVIHAEADPNQIGVSVLYVSYTDFNNTEDVTSFTSETLDYTLTSGTTGTLITATTNTVGQGSIFGITEGVLFVNGYFVRFDSQKVIVDAFNPKANKKVYFTATFSTVNSDEDSTLLDNAQGYNNYNAPGADRLRCELNLQVTSLDTNLDNDNSFLLIEIRDGSVYTKNERTVYNEVADELARRTYNESGDYVVRGWDLRTREHLDTGTNGGRFSEAAGGDADKIVVELEKGLAYVKGFEVETVSTRPIPVNKASEFVYIDDQSSYVTSGPYIVIEEIMGLPNPGSYVSVDLYDTAGNRVSTQTAFNTAPSGTKIGTANIISYVNEDGQLGQPDATVRLYIANVKMNAGKNFADVKAVYSASSFFADVKLTDGVAVIRDAENSSSLVYVGSDHVRSVKSEGGTSDFSLTFMRQDTGSITTGGIVSGIVTLGANEATLYGPNASLGSLAKETLLLHVTESAVISLSGTVSTTANSATVTGSGTSFTNLNEGDRLRIDSTLYNIGSIESDTSLTLSGVSSTTYNGAYSKEYVAGDVIDLDSKGADAGEIRTVSTTSTSITIDLKETFDASTACKLAYRVVKNPATEIAKTIVPSRYVKINGATTPYLDRFYLGVPDALRIRQVRKDTSEITTSTQGEDVTSQFILYKNTTGFAYKTSFIGTTTPITASDHLLIEFDYYDADLAGSGSYFTIDSYPINDSIESDTTIKTIDLSYTERNFIDFRPRYTKTVTPSTTIAGAPSNPTGSTTLDTPAAGYKAAVPGTNVVFDYSYYLARRDVLAVKPNGEFKVIEGRSGIFTSFPRVPESYMAIANITIPPYPSISANYAKILDREDEGVVTEKITYNRHTMADITAMKNRIKNLEYYTSLSLLEKNTFDLTILDENGLDRFKNGIFIDPFTDHSLASSRNPDYNIAVDRKGKNIRPTFEVEGFNTNNMTISANLNGNVKTGPLVHMPFTETTLKEQLLATTTRNVELSSYRYIGGLNLYPDIDTWVDTTTVDKTFDIGNDVPEGQIISTEYGAWQTISSGAVSGIDSMVYKVYHRNMGDKNFNGNEKLLKTFNNIQDVINYVNPSARSSYFKKYKENLSSIKDKDITDENVQDQLDSISRARFFIVYGGNVTTEETILEQRTNTETILTSETENIDIGTFVTDVSIIPYIRPQTIKLYAYGLKPNTRFHVFFDSEEMNDYATPVNVTQYFDSSQSSTGTTSGYQNFNTDLSGMGEEGDKIFSNTNGEVLVYLRLPSGNSKRFRVGEKEIIITDNPTNDPAASSYAKATFVASGLNLQKQNTILSTKTTSTETRYVTEQRQSTIQKSSNVPQGWFEVGPSCAAYSVYVEEEENVEGVYLSSVDIWLSQLHPTLGIWFEIREMSSDGGITRKTLPYSTVWMNRNDPRLKISEDGISNATKVNFEAPVFLYNNTQYAFVIHTEGLNPDTYFWVSRLGGDDVTTGNPVTNRGLFGTFYTTNNNLNWDIVPDIDLKIRFNRAQFDSTLDPITVEFALEDIEFLSSNTTLPSVFFNEGEPVRGSEILKIAVDGASTIQVGDKIVDGVNSANGIVLDVDGTDIYMDGFDFLANSAVTIYQGDTVTVRDTGTVTSVDFGTGVISRVNTEKSRFHITHSNGKFFAGANIRSILPSRHKSVLNGTGTTVTYDGAISTYPNPYAPTGVITLPVGMATSNTTVAPTFTIDSFDTFDYHTTTIRPSYINFPGDTTVDFEVAGTIGTTVQSYVPISPNSEYEFRTTYNVLSRSEEVRLLSGAKSFKVSAIINTESEYVSPILDNFLLGVVFTRNILNNDIAGEENATGGNLENKYISKIVELTPDNAAEDLMVLLQEYRPDTAGVKIWARIKNNSDVQDINDKPWFELDATKVAVSSDANKENYIDTTYTIPVERLTGDQDAVQYTDTGNLAEFSATEMVANTEYTIVSTGTTDYTAVGAANNDVGTTFTATGPATGTGTVSVTSDLIFTRFTEFQLKIGLLGSNAAVYPKASQLRAIALQK